MSNEKSSPRTVLVNVGVSGRHVHLTQQHVEQLFGAGHQLTPTKPLSQPGQFACVEAVTLKTDRGQIEGVRILGPARPETQVELALTDTFRLKLEMVPVRMSGKVAGSPGLTLIGPAGQVTIDQGVIISQRHVHMTPKEAAEAGIKDNEIVAVACGTSRQTIFGNTIVRIRDDFALDFHIDTDEANASGVRNGDQGVVIKGFEWPV